MLRVSTSTIESFRYVMEHEHASEDELVEQIRGKFTPNWKMNAGTAWHRVLETSCVGWSGGDFVQEGEFSFGSMKALNAACELIGPGVWEAKAARIFPTKHGDVNVVAKADHSRGLIIQENKTKFSTPDARDYEGSMQWRFYLLVHEASLVRYNLFDFFDPKNGYCELKNIISFNFWPYAGMQSDSLRWLNSLLDWAESKSLLPYLSREGTSVAA